ncbi:MAG: hypothetical protein KU37_07300 [Sulfuricurvum sp. PC08-66]|nr:MAG: hypothetical protein KU37_07300 [Sulfuricurvum sp. PC08-66]
MKRTKLGLLALIASATLIFTGCGDTGTDVSVSSAVADQTLILRDRPQSVDISSAFKSASGATITLAASSADTTKLTVELNSTTLIMTPLTVDANVTVTLVGSTSKGSAADTIVVALPSSDMNSTTSRTTLAHAGLAEYHTGTGYGKTLFDSAKNKCQNCHNDLYDTWKNSMHAKSWTEGIFQTKYKEYLRIQLSNIGRTSTSTYTMTTITGAAITDGNMSSSTTRTAGGSGKVCVKCHAPGAFYAGDFNITVTKVGTSADYSSKSASELQTYISGLESGGTTTTGVIKVAAVAKDTNVYTVSYHVGHEANREGINCATCHSIESIRLMGVDGATDKAGTQIGVRDGGKYTLKNAITYGPIGAERYAAGTEFSYDSNASNPHMNSFFSLVGPEMYTDLNGTPHDATGFAAVSSKMAKGDGRFTYRSVDINGTNGKTYYTGGPFYGPYGITGTNNSNSGDDSNRSALSLGKDVFAAKDNHFSKHAKALCLSCHQRSAGAQDTASNIKADGTVGDDNTTENQMELCSTWNAMSDDVDNNYLDTGSSPKCTKCHMPRLSDKTVLHQWNKPNKLFPRSELLTGYFDPEDGDNYGEGHNPVKGKWMNDHGFIGGNRLSGTNFLNKIKSGFDADVNASISGNTLTVSTSLLNKTAHMFPGAHPMRRVLTRVIVTDSTGAMVEYNSTATGSSSFENIVNTVVPSIDGDKINTSGTGKGSVGVDYDNTRKIQISGLATDLNNTTVTGQKFANTTVSIYAADVISKIQNIASGENNASVTNAVITTDSNASTFTRIYGRETGKSFNGVFVVRPGFDSSTVPAGKDNRLLPNEKESYTINYDVTNKTGVTVTYKVYYMLTGANGTFPTGTDGWYNGDTTTQRIEEVFSKTVNP